MVQDTSSLGQLSVEDQPVYVLVLSGKKGTSVIRQGAPMTLHGHIPHVGGLGQRPHHQLSHIGLGFSAKEDDGQCLLEGGGLAFRWAEAAALAGGRSCSSTEKTQLSEGQAWAASTRSGPSF